MSFLFDGFMAVTWQQAVMYIVGILLIYLAIRKSYEPSLLLPMGFGAILVNLPFSGVLHQTIEGIGEVQGVIEWLYDLGIGASEAMPLLLPPVFAPPSFPPFAPFAPPPSVMFSSTFDSNA